jgi:hypothetical protein
MRIVHLKGYMLDGLFAGHCCISLFSHAPGTARASDGASRRLFLQLGKVGEEIERFGIRRRLAIFHGDPMYQVAHG